MDHILKHPLLKLSIMSSLLLFAFSCSERGDTPPRPESTLAFEEANSFLQFINTQASLGPGEYTLVMGTQTSSQSGNYSVRVNINGKTQSFSGTWASSGGQDETSAGNPRHTINLSHAGGLTTSTNSSVPAYLYLLKNNQVISEGSEINLAVSQIDSQEYTDAYYRAVDPNDERLTLSSWQRKNGFDQGEDVHVVFRDTKDLGYGRNMHARKDPSTGNISFFVQNYAADLGGEEGQYSAANGIAAIEEMHQYHIGSNAIEFSPIDPNDASSEKILKFFTFRRNSLVEGATEHRRDTANLDGRGEKQMPIPCLVCHGARLLPLDQNGEFQLLSLKSAKLNQLEVESFEFAESGTFTKDSMESQIKIINQYVNETYTEIDGQDTQNFNHWDGEFAIELSEGRYGGSTFSRGTYDEHFIPTGWRQNASRPDGVEELFLEVVQPHCISCHSIRGKDVANISNNQNNDANDINFSTYEKFISYNDVIIDYVFKRGIMPLSLLNYQTFWQDRSGAPSVLASFLVGFDIYDENNLPMEPGRPFARPGEDRSAWSPVQLNGSASSFALTYEWRLISSPSGESGTFNNRFIANPVFTASGNGDYTIELTVRNDLGIHTDSMVLNIDNTGAMLAKHQSQLTFVDDVMDNILGSTAQSLCANCHRSNFHHSAGGGYDNRYDGIPVFYTAVDDTGATNVNLYRHVRARVNLAEPENSLLLRKPVGKHHGGGVRIDRSTLAGERDYQTLLNWIREGAICGSGVHCN